MAKPFNDLIADWPAARLARVEARANELIAEQMTLRDIRKAFSLTQTQVAKTLGIGQEHVSRLEHQSDMLLSTLTGYIKAMGGDLRLVAEFPNRPPVALGRLADIFEDSGTVKGARAGGRKRKSTSARQKAA